MADITSPKTELEARMLAVRIAHERAPDWATGDELLAFIQELYHFLVGGGEGGPANHVPLTASGVASSKAA